MPGRSAPRASAPSTIASAIRSLYDPVGLKYSSFTKTSALPRSGRRLSRTTGVRPMACSTESTTLGGITGPRFRRGPAILLHRRGSLHEHAVRVGLLALAPDVPVGVEAVRGGRRDATAVDVGRRRRVEVGAVDEVEAQVAVLAAGHELHPRLVAHRAVVRDHELAALQVVHGGHLVGGAREQTLDE